MPVVSVQRRQREETHSGSIGSRTCLWDIGYSRNTPQKSGHSTGTLCVYVYVFVFRGWGSTAVIGSTRFVIRKMRFFHCSTKSCILYTALFYTHLIFLQHISKVGNKLQRFIYRQSVC